MTFRMLGFFDVNQMDTRLMGIYWNAWCLVIGCGLCHAWPTLFYALPHDGYARKLYSTPRTGPHLIGANCFPQRSFLINTA